MVKRTSLNLDTDLLAEAAEVLGTERATDTVRKALEEAVRQERLRSLAKWDLGGMTLEDLWEMRRNEHLDDLEELESKRSR